MKLYSFLKLIFVLDDDDDSESESSDESDEEEETGSVDSRDFGIVRLDESVCPKGCDQNLFDLTYTLRGQRLVQTKHFIIDNIKDHKEVIVETLGEALTE